MFFDINTCLKYNANNFDFVLLEMLIIFIVCLICGL